MVRIQNLTYSSQPWPFPSQLVFGLFAYIKHSGAASVRLDLDAELEEVFFATKNDIKDILASMKNKSLTGLVHNGHKVTYV